MSNTNQTKTPRLTGYSELSAMPGRKGAHLRPCGGGEEALFSVKGERGGIGEYRSDGEPALKTSAKSTVCEQEKKKVWRNPLS